MGLQKLTSDCTVNSNGIEIVYQGDHIPNAVWNLLMKNAKCDEVIQGDIIGFESKVINYEIDFYIRYDESNELQFDCFGYDMIINGKKEYIKCVPTISQIKDMKQKIEFVEIDLEEKMHEAQIEAQEYREMMDDPYFYHGVSRTDFI